MDQFTKALDQVEQQLEQIYEPEDVTQSQPVKGVILFHNALTDAGFSPEMANQIVPDFMISLPPPALTALEDHSLLDTLAEYMQDAHTELSDRYGDDVAIKVLKNWVAKIEFEAS